MVDLRQLLRVRYAYAGRFDAGGKHLIFVADLAGVPQVWGLGDTGWPELLVSPPDRAQTIHLGPRPGQLMVGADIGGDEHSQLLYVDGQGADWRDLTNDRAHIHNFGHFDRQGQRISYAANTRNTRWFDVYVRDLGAAETRCALEHDSTNRAGPFSPDGRWLLVTRVFSNAHQELWLIDLEGGQPPRLLTAPGEEAIYEQPQWTTDGQLIYCVSDLGREFVAPARIGVTSGQLAFVVEPHMEVDEAALDPTGQLLAYAVNQDGVSWSARSTRVVRSP